MEFGRSVLLLLLVAGAPRAWASTPTVAEDTTVTASDAAASDEYGTAVAVSGDILVVGAPLESPGGTSQAGAVYAYTTSDGGASWGNEVKLVASGTVTASDEFGVALALDGSFLVVAAHKDDDQGSSAGALYVMSTTDSGASWGHLQKLTDTNGAADDFLGTSVAMDGAIIVGGAPRDDGPSDSGSAPVFRTSDFVTWTQVATLKASDPSVDARFGQGVAVLGDLIAVGAYRDSEAASLAGAVYAFTSSDGGATWGQTAKLMQSAAGLSDGLGLSVALGSGTTTYLAAGARFDDAAASDGGSVNVWTTADAGATFVFRAELVASDAGGSDILGGTMGSVAVAGDYVVGGAVQADTGAGADAGAVYVWTSGDSGVSWTEHRKLTASDGAANDKLGNGVAVDNGLVVAGALTGDTGVSDGGSVYVVRVAVAGAVGDPVLIDFAGHRFLAGKQANTWFRLFAYGRDEVLIRTGKHRGVKRGYFLDSLAIVRDDCGLLEMVGGPGTGRRGKIDVTGPECLASQIALGDNGFALASVSNGDAIMAVKAHALTEDSAFLNIMLLEASDALRAGCTGMLCAEAHIDDVVIQDRR